MAPAPAAGAEDGDPAQPVIALADVKCGGPMGGFGLGSANFKLDERDMIVTYPCNKHAGAPASFILNLHGTTPPEQHFYQHGYFAAHQFAASHNLIIVTPSSVVQQWGNGDDGKDEPHLMHIIDWVYQNLNGPGKFDIKAMWVGGHSWGGGYTARFGCKPELADKVKGLIMMSGGGVGGFGGASCSNKISAIITTAEGDGREPSDQAMLATTHGCGAGMTEMILMNKHTFWPMCQPGFVHANYYMLGKEHATFMDKDVVQSIVNWIKLARQ
jgi:pimeloyl-ACP methyl ester carboxylesterase